VVQTEAQLSTILDSGKIARCTELSEVSLQEFCRAQLTPPDPETVKKQAQLEAVFQSGDVSRCTELSDPSLVAFCKAQLGQ